MSSGVCVQGVCDRGVYVLGVHVQGGRVLSCHHISTYTLYGHGRGIRRHEQGISYITKITDR